MKIIIKIIVVPAILILSVQACSTQQVVRNTASVAKMPVNAAGAVVGTVGGMVGGTAGGMVAGNTGRRVGQMAGQSAARRALP